MISLSLPHRGHLRAAWHDSSSSSDHDVGIFVEGPFLKNREGWSEVHLQLDVDRIYLGVRCLQAVVVVEESQM